MRLSFAQPASRDLDEIFDHVARDNPGAALGILDAVETVARRLIAFPEMGRVGRWPGTREAVVPNLPYVLIYESDGRSVTIIAVLHGARDLPGALEGRTPEEP